MSDINVDRFQATYIVEGRELESLRYEAQWQYENAVERYRSTADSVMRRIQDSLNELDRRGETGNELGILQGSGPEIDRMCAVIKMAKANLAHIDRLIENAKVQA